MDSYTELPKDREPCIRIVAMPKNTNPAGNIFGGWIMEHIDLAASIPAVNRANGRVVTIAVEAIKFTQPIFVGDLVSFYTEIVHEGVTSIKVKVDTYAQRSRHRSHVVKVTEAVVTYVAMDDDGNKCELPPVEEVDM